VGQPIHLEEFFSSKHFNKKFPTFYPWFSVGFSLSSVERVGFRIERIEFSDQKNEILIFEILTNGSISPRCALHEAALILTCEFSAIANVTLPTKHYTDVDPRNFCKKFSSFSNERVMLPNRRFGQTLYSIFDVGLSRFQEPFGLDVGNLTLRKESYSEFQDLGFQTLGHLLERLASDFYSFPYLLEQQRRQAFSRL
jgi:DNA-directed RNA polymerase alpha subunit